MAMEIQGTVEEVPARVYPNRNGSGGAEASDITAIREAMAKLGAGETLKVSFAGTYTEDTPKATAAERDARHAMNRGRQLRDRGFEATSRGPDLYVTNPAEE